VGLVGLEELEPLLPLKILWSPSGKRRLKEEEEDESYEGRP